MTALGEVAAPLSSAAAAIDFVSLAICCCSSCCIAAAATAALLLQLLLYCCCSCSCTAAANCARLLFAAVCMLQLRLTGHLYCCCCCCSGRRLLWCSSCWQILQSTATPTTTSCGSCKFKNVKWPQKLCWLGRRSGGGRSLRKSCKC